MVWFKHFKIKILKTGGKYLSRDKQTRNKVPVMFLDIKVLNERNLLANTQITVSVFSV